MLIDYSNTTANFYGPEIARGFAFNMIAPWLPLVCSAFIIGALGLFLGRNEPESKERKAELP
jgi:hypothetical protein